MYIEGGKVGGIIIIPRLWRYDNGEMEGQRKSGKDFMVSEDHSLLLRMMMMETDLCSPSRSWYFAACF